ncbi:unnamed protein product [Enterobius vermicularis]|uniref:Uncharacterized protein n=1 Tax=Enterobius vermicularis TaxID=51028 RepID=A0A0N4UYW7_ENTVE|nr:unnamed protein product [Enterobius vermicularis]
MCPQSYPCGSQPGYCKLQPPTQYVKLQPQPVTTKIQGNGAGCQVQPAPLACSMRARVTANVVSLGAPSVSAFVSGQAKACVCGSVGQPCIRPCPANQIPAAWSKYFRESSYQ